MQSEQTMRANANAAVRALTNRIYRNFKKRFGEEWDLPAKEIAWMDTDDPRYALGAIGIYRPEHPWADCAMEMTRTVAANAGYLTCPPRTDPSAMRVPTGPGWAEEGFETLDETDTTHT